MPQVSIRHHKIILMKYEEVNQMSDNLFLTLLRKMGYNPHFDLFRKSVTTSADPIVKY